MSGSKKGTTPKVQRGKSTTPGSGVGKKNVAAQMSKFHNTTLFGSTDFLHMTDRHNQTMIPTQTKDVDLQNDIVYSKYLRSFAMKQLAEKQMARLNDSMTNQLLVQGEVLQKQLIIQDKLENELEILAIQKETIQLKRDLQASTEQFSSIIRENQVSEKMDKLSSCLEQACNKLYLNNVKMFTNQDERDKFVSVFETCSNKIQQLNMLHGPPEDIKKLADSLKKYAQLKEDFNKELLLTEGLDKQSDAMLLKVTSDMFAKKNGYL